MGAKPVDFPGVRLLAAGCLNLVLLLWVTAFDDSWQWTFARHGPMDPKPMLATAAISLLTIMLLLPVLMRGLRRERGLAVLVAVFPLLMFLLAAAWLL